jgi:hypothetical protein
MLDLGLQEVSQMTALVMKPQILLGYSACDDNAAPRVMVGCRSLGISMLQIALCLAFEDD